jgi:hypothetical protein
MLSEIFATPQNLMLSQVKSNPANIPMSFVPSECGLLTALSLVLFGTPFQRDPNTRIALALGHFLNEISLDFPLGEMSSSG